MLPFLKKRPNQGMIVESISTDQSQEAPKDEALQAVTEAAKDLLYAIQEQNPKKMAQALRAAFEICDAMPHQEGPHTNEE